MSKQTEKSPHFRQVAICGVGLLGGSLAMALRERKLADHVNGIGRNAERLRAAQEQGIIDSYGLDIAEGCSQADLVVLCGPVSVILEQIPTVMRSVPSGALVTDVGSTKRSIVERAAQNAKPDAFFVGSHPIAGSEKSGVEHAKPDLFENAAAILTPDLDTPNAPLALARELWKAVGMRVLEVSPARHDHLLAALSHLPHLAAAALVAHLMRALDEDAAFMAKVAGSGFRETTRIAMGSVPMWVDICAENRDAILHVLDAYISVCLEVRKQVSDGDAEGLRHFFETARQLRKEF